MTRRALLIASLTWATACHTDRPVYAVASTVKANRVELASGTRTPVHTTDDTSFTVSPKTNVTIMVYGPADEGGGRQARPVTLTIRDLAADCISNDPCMLDKIPSNIIQIGTKSEDTSGFQPILLSTVVAGAIGGVCVSGVCGEALEIASPPLLIGSGVIAVFLLALRFAR